MSDGILVGAISILGRYMKVDVHVICNLLGIVETVECVISRAKVDACNLENALISIVC